VQADADHGGGVSRLAGEEVHRPQAAVADALLSVL
jgi:hypothetical protein